MYRKFMGHCKNKYINSWFFFSWREICNSYYFIVNFTGFQNHHGNTTLVSMSMFLERLNWDRRLTLNSGVEPGMGEKRRKWIDKENRI